MRMDLVYQVSSHHHQLSVQMRTKFLCVMPNQNKTVSKQAFRCWPTDVNTCIVIANVSL